MIDLDKPSEVSQATTWSCGPLLGGLISSQPLPTTTTYHLGLRGEKQASGKFRIPVLLSSMLDEGDCSAIMDAGDLFGLCYC